MIAERTPTTLCNNHKKLNDRIIEIERSIHRLEQYFCCECIEIAGVLSSIINNFLEEHVILIFEKLGVVMGGNEHSSLS